MEKLIELLNEYDIEREYYSESGYLFYIDKETWIDYDDRRFDYEIISKQYKFVERLVYADKINREKTEITPITQIALVTSYWLPKSYDEVQKRYWLYEQLLMLLSIQEEPIKFLVSILR